VRARAGGQKCRRLADCACSRASMRQLPGKTKKGDEAVYAAWGGAARTACTATPRRAVASLCASAQTS